MVGHTMAKVMKHANDEGEGFVLPPSNPLATLMGHVSALSGILSRIDKKDKATYERIEARLQEAKNAVAEHKVYSK